MPIKYLKLETERLLEKCRLGDRKSQRLLYEKYADQFLGICRRYLYSLPEAEDALMKGFVKIFTKLNNLQDDSKFDYWARRIMANECLMVLRKKKKMKLTELSDHIIPIQDGSVVDNLSADEILKLVDVLPIGYKTVFNMYVIEGFKHKEIAATLGVSINTSKSQLIMARKRLQAEIEKLNSIGQLNSTNQAKK